MNAWLVTWMNGNHLVETVVPTTNIYNLPSALQSAGVWNLEAVIKVEKMAVRQ